MNNKEPSLENLRKLILSQQNLNHSPPRQEKFPSVHLRSSSQSISQFDYINRDISHRYDPSFKSKSGFEVHETLLQEILGIKHEGFMLPTTLQDLKNWVKKSNEEETKEKLIQDLEKMKLNIQGHKEKFLGKVIKEGGLLYRTQSGLVQPQVCRIYDQIVKRCKNTSVDLPRGEIELGAPSGRKEVEIIITWLEYMTQKHIDEVNDLTLEEKVRRAQLIYTACYKEVIRQVSVHCIERGVLLQRIWNASVDLNSLREDTRVKQLEDLKDRINKIIESSLSDLKSKLDAAEQTTMDLKIILRKKDVEIDSLRRSIEDSKQTHEKEKLEYHDIGFQRNRTKKSSRFVRKKTIKDVEVEAENHFMRQMSISKVQTKVPVVLFGYFDEEEAFHKQKIIQKADVGVSMVQFFDEVAVIVEGKSVGVSTEDDESGLSLNSDKQIQKHKSYAHKSFQCPDRKVVLKVVKLMGLKISKGVYEKPSDQEKLELVEEDNGKIGKINRKYYTGSIDEGNVQSSEEESDSSESNQSFKDLDELVTRVDMKSNLKKSAGKLGKIRNKLTNRNKKPSKSASQISVNNYMKISARKPKPPIQTIIKSSPKNKAKNDPATLSLPSENDRFLNGSIEKAINRKSPALNSSRKAIKPKLNLKKSKQIDIESNINQSDGIYSEKNQEKSFQESLGKMKRSKNEKKNAGTNEEMKKLNELEKGYDRAKINNKKKKNEESAKNYNHEDKSLEDIIESGKIEKSSKIINNFDVSNNEKNKDIEIVVNEPHEKKIHKIPFKEAPNLKETEISIKLKQNSYRERVTEKPQVLSNQRSIPKESDIKPSKRLSSSQINSKKAIKSSLDCASKLSRDSSPESSSPIKLSPKSPRHIVDKSCQVKLDEIPFENLSRAQIISSIHHLKTILSDILQHQHKHQDLIKDTRAQRRGNKLRKILESLFTINETEDQFNKLKEFIHQDSDMLSGIDDLRSSSQKKKPLSRTHSRARLSSAEEFPDKTPVTRKKSLNSLKILPRTKANIQFEEFNLGQHSKKIITTHPGPKLLYLVLQSIDNISSLAPSLTIKSLIKTINSVHSEKISLCKDNANYKKFEASMILYDFLSNMYGLKTVAENKFKQVVISTLAYKDSCPRVSNFCRFLGIEGVFVPEDWNFYLTVFESLDYSSSGFSIFNEVNHYSSLQRVHFCVKSLFENKLSEEAIEDILRTAFTMKIDENEDLGRKKALRTEDYINTDRFLEYLLDWYYQLKKKVYEKSGIGLTREDFINESQFLELVKGLEIVKNFSVIDEENLIKIFEIHSNIRKDEEEKADRQLKIESLLNMLIDYSLVNLKTL